MIRDRVMDPVETSSLERSTSWLATFMIGAAVGAATGAAVALLVAPTSGRKSRAWLRDGARKLREGAEDRLDRAHDAFEDGKSSVRGAVEGGAGVLRESVEAARDGYKRARDESSETRAAFREAVDKVDAAGSATLTAGKKA